MGILLFVITCASCLCYVSGRSLAWQGRQFSLQSISSLYQDHVENVSSELYASNYELGLAIGRRYKANIVARLKALGPQLRKAQVKISPGFVDITIQESSHSIVAFVKVICCMKYLMQSFCWWEIYKANQWSTASTTLTSLYLAWHGMAPTATSWHWIWRSWSFGIYTKNRFD